MPQFYVYLISSLPMLHFGAKPPFTSEKFINMCEDFIPSEDLSVIASAVSVQYTGSRLREANEAKQSPCSEEIASSAACGSLLAKTIFKSWREFDTQLRNELVKIRAAKKRVDPATYLRQDGSVELSVTHIALAAARNPSIIEAEKILDQERWHFLDELSAGHYFDIDFLIIYAVKLKILERWAKINSSDPAQEVRQLC